MRSLVRSLCSASCAGAMALAFGVALAAQGVPAESKAKTWFTPPGWDNVHRAGAGVTSFVFRPMAHVVDATATRLAAENLRSETLGFPYEIWQGPTFGRGQLILVGRLWPLFLESTSGPGLSHFFLPMHRGVEHSVAVGVERDAKGRLLRVVGAPEPGSAIEGVVTKDALTDADLPEPKLPLLGGPPLALKAESQVPDRLAVALKSAAPIAVAHEIVATLRYEQLPWTVKGEVVVSEHRVRGVVAADGRFRLWSTIDHLDEHDQRVPVTTEASCDLRGLALRVEDHPSAVVWSTDHDDVRSVLASSARFALPLIAWVRDPSWLADGRSAAWQAAGESEWRGIPSIEDFVGEIRCRVADTEWGPLIDRVTSVIPGLEEFRTELEFADYFELAPGYLRPRVVRLTNYQNGAPDTKLELRIERAAIPSARRKFEWLPRGDVRIWHLMR